jgi:hypothetical protein
MSLQIGKAIYSLLSSDDELTNKVHNKIFPLIANINTTFPFIVYKRDSIEPQYTKDYLTGETITMEIVIASNDYVESIEIADKVRSILDNYRGTVEGISIRNIRMTEADEDYLEDTYI